MQVQTCIGVRLTLETLAEVRVRTLQQLAMLSPSHKRLLNPHQYVVGLESGLFARKTELILREREVVRKLREAAKDPQEL